MTGWTDPDLGRHQQRSVRLGRTGTCVTEYLKSQKMYKPLTCESVDSSILAFSAASVRRCSAWRSLRRSMPSLLLEVVCEVVYNAPVKVIASQVGVSRGGQHLKHTIAHLRRHIEHASSHVGCTD